MNLSKKIMLIISLMPIILSFLVAGLNLRNNVRIKFLIWTFPEISLGTALLIASSTSFCIGTFPYLIDSTPQLNKRRKVIIKNPDSEDYGDNNLTEVSNQLFEEESPIYIERDVRDPLPTVSVPYKVISQVTNEIVTEEKKTHIHQSYASDNLNGKENQSINSTQYTSVNDWGQLVSDDW